MFSTTLRRIAYLPLLLLFLLIVALGNVEERRAFAAEAPAAMHLDVVQMPTSLNGVKLIAFGGLASGSDVDHGALRMAWASSNQGWLTTWSLKIESGVGLLGDEGVTLSAVWPKAGHTYEARFDFVAHLGAMSINVYNATEETTVYSGLIHLEGSGPWTLLTPQEAWAEVTDAEGVVLAKTLESSPTAALRGLPLPLQQPLVFSLRSSDALVGGSLGQGVVVGQDLLATFNWPRSRVLGQVEFRLETESQQVVSLGATSWSEEPVQVPIDLAQIGPGTHRLHVDYVLGDMREPLLTRSVVVYEGVLDVEIQSLRMPRTLSVVDSGVQWTFHDKEVIEGTFIIEATESARHAQLQLEVWSRGTDGHADAATPLDIIPFVLSGGQRGRVQFAVAVPPEVDQVQLVITGDMPQVALQGRTQMNLQKTPVAWTVPGETLPRAIASLPEIPGVEHFNIFHATPAWGTFSHHAQIFHHDGVFYASWSNHSRDEDAPSQRILFSLSRDGREWTHVNELFPPNDHPAGSAEDGRYMTAQRHSYQTGFVAIDSGVYALASVIEWESGRRSKLGEMAREVRPDGTLGPIFWLIPDPPGPQPGFPNVASAADASFRELAANIIANAQPITWRAYVLTAADGHGIVELTSYLRPDGTGVLLGRDGENTGFMYAATGRPERRAWNPMVRVNIPDSPSLSDTGVLPDGRIYLIHNPARARDPLVLSLSRDGVSFDQAWIIRAGAPGLDYSGMWKTRGYQYPSSVVADDALWVMYSDGKEHVHVSRIPLESLGE